MQRKTVLKRQHASNIFRNGKALRSFKKESAITTLYQNYHWVTQVLPTILSHGSPFENLLYHKSQTYFASIFLPNQCGRIIVNEKHVTVMFYYILAC